MKYMKKFETYLHPYPLVGNYLINDNTKSEKMVDNYIKHYGLNPNILNIWKKMVEKYKEYPIKINTDEVLYTSKDNQSIHIKLEGDKITKIIKDSKVYKDQRFVTNIYYEGDFSFNTLETLYLGNSTTLVQ